MDWTKSHLGGPLEDIGSCQQSPSNARPASLIGIFERRTDRSARCGDYTLTDRIRTPPPYPALSNEMRKTSWRPHIGQKSGCGSGSSSFSNTTDTLIRVPSLIWPEPPSQCGHLSSTTWHSSRANLLFSALITCSRFQSVPRTQGHPGGPPGRPVRSPHGRTGEWRWRPTPWPSRALRDRP